MLLKSSPAAYAVLRTSLGLLLLAAAALKAHQLATRLVVGERFLDSRLFLTFWVNAEVLLGLWLMSGLAPRLVWLLAAGCFAVFSVVTLADAIRGQESCGCLGAVEVNPRFMFIIDCLSLAALAVFRPNLREQAKVPHHRPRFLAVLVLALAACIPATILSAGYEPARLSDQGEVIGKEGVVLLEPDSWQGKRLPLLPHVDIAERISRGHWLVILFSHDCPKCAEAIRTILSESPTSAPANSPRNIALVEVPPYGGTDEPADTAASRVVRGKLSDKRNWFVETPTILHLQDGVVTNVSHAWRPGDGEPGTVAASQTRPAPVGPVVPVDGNEHSLGYVGLGSTTTMTIGIMSPADKPITIRNIRSECTCMTGLAPAEPVAPGKRIPVVVTFVAPVKPQHYSKRLVLVTDHSKHAAIPIAIAADVGLPLIAEPASLDFGTVPVGEKRELSVMVRNRSAEPVRLLYSTSADGPSSAKVPAKAIPPGAAASLPVVVSADKVGRQERTLLIHTDCPSQPVLRVPVAITGGK